jgi:pyrrolysine biosynthesis protein PylC
VYQHVRAAGGLLEVCGEHVMGSAAPLRLVSGFFGADEALTDYRPDAESWSATIIVASADMAAARCRADAAVAEMARRHDLKVLPEVEACDDEKGGRR